MDSSDRCRVCNPCEHPAVVALDDVLAEMGMTMDSVQIGSRRWSRHLDPNTSCFVVGTPMSHTDLYHRMLSEKQKSMEIGDLVSLP